MRYVLLLAWLLMSCGSDSNPSAPIDETQSIEKSAKRGLAYDLTDSADFSALQEGVSWWYNWYYSTAAITADAAAAEMTFIPMLWGGSPSQLEQMRAKAFILDHPEIAYVLVMNEPNLVDQANRTPDQAALDWLVYEQFVDDIEDEGRDLALVGPAMNWGTLENFEDPVVWLDAFYQEYRTLAGKDPRIDYLAFHWYDYGLEQQLDRLQKYGKQIWITEMANWNPVINSYQLQAEQMTSMVATCEARDNVFRYAWFIGRGTLPDNHFTFLLETDPGTLTSLGELYLELPY